MHCRSCELLLEKSLSGVRGVKRARVSFKKGTAEIVAESANQPDSAELSKAVSAAGYSLGKENPKLFFSRNSKDYLELIAVTLLVLLAYLILKGLGVFSLNFGLAGAPSFTTVLLVGLTAGISSCMALVGGLVLGISARHAELHPQASASEKFRPHLFFNMGRLVSYALLGGIIGLLGSTLRISSPVLGIITIALGVVMLFLGLKLIEIFPRLSNKTVALPKSIGRLLGLGGEQKEYSHRGTFLTGALTFFVPCGFTQAMQLYAVSTGSFVSGAVIMFLFALGTLPGIISIGGLTSLIKGSFARWFFKFAGVVVISLALFNIANGSSLAGFSLPSLVSSSSGGFSAYNGAAAVMENGKQVVMMEQSATGYFPPQFTVKKGTPVLWKITSTSQYTCAAFIVLRQMGIAQPLKLGENIIEFTPTQTGQMRFTCSMGMYSGTFNVID